MTVSVDGEQRYNWPVSTGRAGRDTPSGSYRAFRMEKDHYSKEWDDAPMPNSVFFTQVGHAIHGSYETKKIGSPASAGCVRLAPENAETLFELIKDQGVLNTTVEVTGDLRVALARRTPSAEPEEADDSQQRSYGSTPGYYDPRPRYQEIPQPQYAQPAPYPYGAPVYGDRYYVRRPAPLYVAPPGYDGPYPRYYRW
jgi:hypothetical protein